MLEMDGGMIEVLKYIAWGLALFFAGAWTMGVFRKPGGYVAKSIIVTVLFWWIEIGLAVLGFYSVLHLFWLMPLSVIIPGSFESMEVRTRLYSRVGSIFVKSSIPLGVAIGVLIYMSRIGVL